MLARATVVGMKPAANTTLRGTAMDSQVSRSIPHLVSDAVGQLAKLISNELELARAEAAAKMSQAGRAAAMLGAGAIILIPALVLLLMAAAAGLMHAGLSDPIAYLITGGVATVASLALIWIGVSSLSGDALKPTVTLDQVQRDKAAVQEMMR
jgi:uncharacterized protein YbjQ (UPF0145 family)